MNNRHGQLKYLLLFFIMGALMVGCAVKRKIPPPDNKAEIKYKETVVESEYEYVEEDKKIDPEIDETGLKPEKGEIIDEENIEWEDAGYKPGDINELENFKPKNINFEYDKSDLSEEARKMLGTISRWMDKNPDIKLRIEGHADDRGTSEYNLALGDRRANAVKKYLLLLTIDGSRLSTISYGEEMPIDSGQNEAAWTKNRRVHFESK